MTWVRSGVHLPAKQTTLETGPQLHLAPAAGPPPVDLPPRLADETGTTEPVTATHTDPHLRDPHREAALTALFDAHYTGLLRLAVLLGADDAEDIVAEAFCQLHRRWNRLRTTQAALAYLRSMVCNLARMRLRHLQVVRKNASRNVDSAESAESAALLRADQQALVAALQHLSARQREALVLRYWLDLRESEIAEAMGISAGAVKAHTSRGMAALTRALKERR